MSHQLRLFHFSENPNIELFVPRPRPLRKIIGRPDEESLVWAIDEGHSPMYLFPRECPRLLLWPIAGSTTGDIREWMGEDPLRMVAYIERGWVERIEACSLYRYEFGATAFESINDAGAYVSERTTTPSKSEAVGGLGKVLGNADVELRIIDSLQEASHAVTSSLHLSAVRSRNAKEWNPRR